MLKEKIEETARYQSDLKDSERMVEKLMRAGTGTGGTDDSTDHTRSPPSGPNPSSPSTQSSTPASTKRGDQTPPATTRGVASSLAASLDDAKADSKTGMRKHDKIIHTYDFVLHEPPQSVLDALLGNSLKSGIGDLRQRVVKRDSEFSSVVHWEVRRRV